MQFVLHWFQSYKRALATSVVIILLCNNQPQNLSDIPQQTLTFSHEARGQLGSSTKWGQAWLTLNELTQVSAVN